MKHPDLLERVTAEADALFAGGTPTVKELRELDVIHRVAMETLRRHSISPMVQRTVSNSFEFEGYKVPAGKQVFLALSVAHGMEEYFPDPQRFDIDRYTRERAEHRQRGAYVPFGLGHTFAWAVASPKCSSRSTSQPSFTKPARYCIRPITI